VSFLPFRVVRVDHVVLTWDRIINLQMEGSSGSPGPSKGEYRVLGRWLI
jgi:hypothetical protein